MFTPLSLPSQDSQGNIVRERLSGKELIHNDGNGFISEDLAELIPAGISQGCLPQERKGSEVRTGAFELSWQLRGFSSSVQWVNIHDFISLLSAVNCKNLGPSGAHPRRDQPGLLAAGEEEQRGTNRCL
jgi:hypothetical protein